MFKSAAWDPGGGDNSEADFGIGQSVVSGSSLGFSAPNVGRIFRADPGLGQTRPRNGTKGEGVGSSHGGRGGALGAGYAAPGLIF